MTLQVLYLTEPIDEVAIQNLAEYGDKKFVDVSREGIDLGTDDQDTKKVGKAILPASSLLALQPVSLVFCGTPAVTEWGILRECQQQFEGGKIHCAQQVV